MILEACDIKKGYPEGGGRWLPVLEGVSISVKRGEVVTVTGESGAGKSTLLHILGLLDEPDSGEVILNNTKFSESNGRSRARIRNTQIGFVFQFHHLLPEFDTLENVAIPAMLGGVTQSGAKKRAKELLEKVNMLDRADHYPNALSGGEQQRAALARALICEPSIILADEPTGNLDSRNEDILIGLLLELAKERGLAVVLATHNRKLAARTDAMYVLENGLILPLKPDRT